MNEMEKITTRINKDILRILKEEAFKEDSSLQEVLNMTLEIGLKTKHEASSTTSIFDEIRALRKMGRFMTAAEEAKIVQSAKKDLEERVKIK